MPWQDLVLTAGSVIFIIALLPSIFSRNKPATATSVTTGAVLVIFSIVYLTLSLWVSSTTTLILGTLWFFLAWQKYKTRN